MIEYEYCKGYKIELFPTDDQKKVINSYFGATRFAYNAVIDYEINIREEKGKFDLAISSMYPFYKKLISQYEWIKKYSNYSIRAALNDAINAYRYFVKRINRIPKYKKKKYNEQYTNVRSDRMHITDEYIQIPSIGLMKHGYIQDKNILGSGNKNKTSQKFTHYLHARLLFELWKILYIISNKE